jgi:hypothetical protein
MLCMLLPHSHHATASLAGVRGYCINVEQERRARGAFGPPKVRSRQEILIVIAVILGRAVGSMRSYQSFTQVVLTLGPSQILPVAPLASEVYPPFRALTILAKGRARAFPQDEQHLFKRKSSISFLTQQGESD